ncbi:patatin-like phospholipase family protein [Bradyrhizobium sp. NBAIM01]|uniref:patatin-like phospholipase family protein n=1 Tax=Bradyrhizobium sp. NBAIM01 TaxID=2793818 RepID=UPI001CD65000|nr:patatin-like phospholipase family protein [Bradyrhizobium sp. NBAIM01]MCA1511478.1 patatin-like phospholipase family protein [Bradyrhizobium sp. NBAIM01]
MRRKISVVPDLLGFGGRATDVRPIGWDEVHADELAWIRKRRESLGGRSDGGNALDMQLSALSLSGGGIRSAAFALGVIQALASRKLLKHFDYLSTVSGGGYVGAFLTAWVQRTDYDKVEKQLDLWARPAPDSPLSHLRRYSRYLAPHSGLLSPDTLTIVALFTRNLLLNWMIIFPFVIAGIIAVKFGAMGVWLLDRVEWLQELPALLASIGLALIGASLVDSLRQRPGWESEVSQGLRFNRNELIPMAFGTIFTMTAAATAFATNRNFGLADAVSITGTGAVIGLTVWLLAFYFARKAELDSSETGSDSASAASPKSTDSTVATEPAKRYVVLTAFSFTIAGAVTGAAAALVVYAFPMIKPDWMDRDLAIITFGPPLAMSALFFGELAYIGLASKTPWADAEREWLARAAGYHSLVAGIYLIVTVLVLFGSPLMFKLRPTLGPQLIAAAGVLAGILIAVLGKAPSTAAMKREQVNSWTAVLYRAILGCAMPVFLASAAILISWQFDDMLFGKPLTRSYFTSAPTPHVPLLMAMTWTLWAFIGLTVLGLIVSHFVNINRFSLHNIYRNRLIRTFLGASHTGRTPNLFTDFDERDNLKLRDIWPSKAEPLKGKPAHEPTPPPQFLVVNMALNTLASQELQLQERRALSFVATPQYIGSGDQKWRPSPDAVPIEGCFRPAAYYNGGMSLGTAVTISGAAASPNMGYHSSPSLGVLMTMFNVRLGMWAGNPGPEGAATFFRQGPRPAYEPLFREAMGMTKATDPYVYLSDGGHFENLGAYEMIRRRCKYIMISDAACDPNYGYEDLGNLVRRVSIDFGVRIKFRRPLDTSGKASPHKGEPCSLADIYYPDDGAAPPDLDDEAKAERRHGLLFYVKPVLFGTEPTSVIAYFNQHPEFPHESTANQWFGETQFEAYRALGAFVMEEALSDVRPGCGSEIADLFAVLDDRYPK